MAQDNYDSCLSFVLTWEGGNKFTNDPKDPGGPTRYGVTQAVYDAYRQRHDLPKRTVYMIDPVEVSTIYHDEYWAPIGCDSLPTGVDLLAFDIGVNSGLGRVRPWLIDTMMMLPGDRIRALDAKRRGFWRHLAIFGRFGRGWLRREDACLALALKMDKPKVVSTITGK